MGLAARDAQGFPRRTYLTIGEVLGRLRAEFPDVTISKIRFLEAEGLVGPERTASGYRKFAPADVDRLRYVLACQRDRYLPLRVIREHLEALDRGEEAALPASGSAEPAGTDPPAEPVSPMTLSPGGSELRLSRTELARAAGIGPDQLAELERYGLVSPRPGTERFDGDALAVARTVVAMAQYGVEPRHLRAAKTAADREIGLIEQIVSPYAGQRGAAARERAQAVVAELAALSVRLHSALIRAGLAAELRR